MLKPWVRLPWGKRIYYDRSDGLAGVGEAIGDFFQWCLVGAINLVKSVALAGLFSVVICYAAVLIAVGVGIVIAISGLPLWLWIWLL